MFEISHFTSDPSGKLKCEDAVIEDVLFTLTIEKTVTVSAAPLAQNNNNNNRFLRNFVLIR